VRIVRGNGDLTRPSNVPWSVAGTGPNPLLRTDFVGGQFPSGVAPFAAGDTEFLVQLNFAAGQPPAVARTGVLALGVPDWGTLDPRVPRATSSSPTSCRPTRTCRAGRPPGRPGHRRAERVGAVGRHGRGRRGRLLGRGLAGLSGPDPTAATQRVALWSRTPLPGTDWRLSFTYARADTAAPSPLAAVATTLLLGCAGRRRLPGRHPDVRRRRHHHPEQGAPRRQPGRPAARHRRAARAGRRAARRSTTCPAPSGSLPRVIPTSSSRRPPSTTWRSRRWAARSRSSGARRAGRGRTTRSPWPSTPGLQWGLFVVPNRDASFSNLTVSSYLGDVVPAAPLRPDAALRRLPRHPPVPRWRRAPCRPSRSSCRRTTPSPRTATSSSPTG
jgi:hypothetical protein